MVKSNCQSNLTTTLSLGYQQDIFEQLRQEDALLILAGGLGLSDIVSNFLFSCDEPGNTVVVIGAEASEGSWIGESMVELASRNKQRNARGLMVINTDSMGIEQRFVNYPA